MTLEDIKKLVVQADPDATHHFSVRRGDYTSWHEYEAITETADDVHEEGWHFQIDRFTRQENDPIITTLRAVLDAAEGVTYSLQVDFEQDTKYLHYVFSCEGI